MQMEIELLTVKHLCDRYNVQPITIRRWIASGQFPAPLRIGPRKVFWPAAVIAEHERTVREVAAKKAADNLQILVPQSGETAKV